ncbi:hypothetical protein MTP09_13900 [Chryseobacterium suipulveris]|uniref:Lipoprotein n=1 Tax=Chryseobacterium suipulveris TaxID=2929800 RepID=A0ABY4BP72_9FLAO|nr:hypothetical protein [Chryseobacterium suipulveris]UOE40977.1 hypothetical protein MTP09_13900 [Chryseobacterium suipulveris]
MKNILLCTLVLTLFSCGKKTADSEFVEAKTSSIPPYDTVAKDSFSAGAISVDVARRIRMSSQIYQDSLREVRKKLEEEKLANKLKEEKEKADKKAEEEKKKAEEAKKTKEQEKPKTETPSVDNQSNP